MKNILSLALLVLIIAASSCKKKTTETEKQDLKIKFSNTVGGNPISKGNMVHTNAAGNMYSVDILKYYVSNVVLTNDQGEEVALKNYDLINMDDESSTWINIASLPYGNFTSMKFKLGIDSARNHTGAQDGDLDPIHNMIWNWNTGYIFFKHEGVYKINDSTTGGLQFHLGTDNALSNIIVPIQWNINKDSKALYIDFDLNKMYNNPAIDFKVDNDRQSTTASDIPWINNMVQNTNDAFTFNRAE